ncbi:hypothetical protein BO221_10615 [Archangium sp. Cb G35]|uniref:hypothetical protein n=1 Tax=Archangium sp. Cb G35 TaxID=1920190 RepID=UPI000936FA8D|nr:hypothetical protein [Archangium sp. Cb G35]OJT24851.1 hypothetical protein BO221_10615 [Archangium sp. Cb G35]
MRPPVCSARAEPRGGRAGFTLLALLLVLAAMTLVVATTLQLGEDERRSASLVRHDARALALAELGVERSRAYLAALLATDVDLDRALDPMLNTECILLPTLGAGQEDDHLPVFTDPGWEDVELPGTGKYFRLVPHEGGAYLVRFDDNDDDGDSPASEAATLSNPGLGCSEGDDLAPGKSNPVRDRDQTVILTVVGIYPGTDPATAQARKVLRVRVGPQPAAGIIAGGTIEMDGASHVCGAHGDIFATGDISGTGCMCGTGCTGGPPAKQACEANTTCVAQSGGDVCSATGGGSSSQCIPGTTVPQPPPVRVWSSLNAPPGCVSGLCTPFYYLREQSGGAQVFMWNYSKLGCEKPQTCSRIFHPGEAATTCGGCWKSVYDASTCTGAKTKEVRKSEDSGLTKPDPDPWTPCGNSAPLIWKTSNPAFASIAGGCDPGSGLYPEPSPGKWSKDASFSGSFQSQGALLPGVWMVEGNVEFLSNSPSCTAATSWKASVLAQGNMDIQAGLSLSPALPTGVALLAGRDMKVWQGNTFIDTCGESAALLVHEQFYMGANTHLTGQLVVENAGACSGLVNGPSGVTLKGNATIEVPEQPPISSGRPASVLEWSESSY